MTQANQTIRRTAAGADVKLWQIAEKLGYTDSYFSRMLRKELSKERKEQILKIISELKTELNNEEIGEQI